MRHWLGEMAPNREYLRNQLLEIGFDEVRFTGAGEVPELYRKRYREWLDQGGRADMTWIDRSLEKRNDPSKILPGVESVILLGVNYLPDQEAAREQDRWAKYALHRDYHDTIKPALAAAGKVLEERLGLAGTDYRYYNDTGPVMERGWAARAGLGFQGKNGMLISRTHGNWLLLSVILVRAAIEPDGPLADHRKEGGAGREVGLLCGSCTNCIEACPTGAIVRPGIVDARLCISYQTIENKGVIPRALRGAIGTRIFGCDICLDVCPWNRFARAGKQLLLSSRYDLVELTLGEILTMSRETFARVFAKTPIKRLKWRGLLRNACVVAGNLRETGSRDVGEEIEDLRPALVSLADHEEAMVRVHAVWAVYRLWPREAMGLLAAAREREREEAVLEEYAAGEGGFGG